LFSQLNHSEPEMRFLHVSWNDVQEMSEKLAEMVVESGFKPDVVVAVSRGGFAPARILCDLLDIKKLASVKVEYYTSVGVRGKEPVIVYPLNADVKGLSVLVVDDVADSGYSLLKAKTHVEEKGASEVRTATLHYKPWSVIKPDYYVDETEDWVVYPWEVAETVRDLYSKLKSEDLDREEIVERLVSYGFERGFVEKILSAKLPQTPPSG